MYLVIESFGEPLGMSVVEQAFVLGSCSSKEGSLLRFLSECMAVIYPHIPGTPPTNTFTYT